MSPRKRVRLDIVLLLLLGWSALPASAQLRSVTKTFCITGNSNGVGWDFAVSINGPNPNLSPVFEFTHGPLLPVPPANRPRGPTDLAAAFGQTINALGNPRLVAGGFLSPGCTGFTITYTPAAPQKPLDLQLFVATRQDEVGSDLCRVTAAGCDFNPLITELTVPIPILPRWGHAAFVLLLLACGTFVLLRTWPRITNAS